MQQPAAAADTWGVSIFPAGSIVMSVGCSICCDFLPSSWIY